MNAIRLKGGVGKSAVTSWVAVTAAAGFLFGSSQSFAAMPAANSVIGNQATASYVDSTNVTQVATSNLVQTKVQQVGAFVLTADSAASGSAGSTVYVSHTLTNSGNGADVFNIAVSPKNDPAVDPEIAGVLYLDADGNGQPDSTTPMSSTQTVLGGASLRFVVAYKIPVSAGNTWSRQATVKVSAGTSDTWPLYSTWNSSLPSVAPSEANTDSISLTNKAAFAVTSSFTTPTVTGAIAWNAAKSTGKVNTGTVITLTYVNNGATAGSLYLKEVLPAVSGTSPETPAFIYGVGSAAWSSLPGVALDETGTVTQQGNGATIQYKYNSLTRTIEAWISNVNPNVTGTISFNVTIASNASKGTSDTRNVASYNSTACSTEPTDLASAATNCTGLTNTNVSPFTVIGSYGLQFGALDSALGTPSASGDEIIKATGATVYYYEQNVTNNGDVVDTFNLKSNTSSFVSTFPQGTTFTWFMPNKTTPLIDTNGDGIVDTGPIESGKSMTVVLQVVLPSGYVNAANAVYQVRPEARSVNDTTQYDLFVATLSTFRFSVTPSNTGQVSPGGSVTYSHAIENTGAYSCFADGLIRVNVKDLPSGWTAAVYIDKNSDGAIDKDDILFTSTGTSGSFPIPASVLPTGQLSPGQKFNILVRLFAASGAAAGEQSIVTIEVTDITTSRTACSLSTQYPSDTTNVITGQVRVQKKHVADANCDAAESLTPATSFVGVPITVKPGECVIYQVTATNEGTTAVNDVMVADAVPEYTGYTGDGAAVGTQVNAGSQCVGVGTTGTVTFSKNPNGVTLNCGGSNVVSPGGSITMMYSVKLNSN